MYFHAIYDYTATNSDEVSFVEGDIIVNLEGTNDAGWIYGTVWRTTQTGIIPFNYLELVKGA